MPPGRPIVLSDLLKGRRFLSAEEWNKGTTHLETPEPSCRKRIAQTAKHQSANYGSANISPAQYAKLLSAPSQCLISQPDAVEEPLQTAHGDIREGTMIYGGYDLNDNGKGLTCLDSKTLPG